MKLTSFSNSIAGSNNSFVTDPTMIKIGSPGSREIKVDATIEVFNLTINPYYRYYPLSGVHENNLAIVLLKTAITKVSPIALAGSSSAKADSYTKVEDPLLAGWGKISESNKFN